jgi:hypothetical protein
VEQMMVKVRHRTISMPEEVYEALRVLAFEERSKITRIVLRALDLEFKRLGLPSVAELRGAGSEPSEESASRRGQGRMKLAHPGNRRKRKTPDNPARSQ